MVAMRTAMVMSSSMVVMVTRRLVMMLRLAVMVMPMLWSMVMVVTISLVLILMFGVFVSIRSCINSFERLPHNIIHLRAFHFFLPVGCISVNSHRSSLRTLHAQILQALQHGRRLWSVHDCRHNDFWAKPSEQNYKELEYQLETNKMRRFAFAATIGRRCCTQPD